MIFPIYGDLFPVKLLKQITNYSKYSENSFYDDEFAYGFI